jgi:tricorn protease
MHFGITMTSALILALAANSLNAAQPSVVPQLLRQPDIHGNTVVFLYAGDLWAASTEPNSVAKRIATNVGARTGNPAQGPVARPCISPDGKTVAFTAGYDGSFNVYTVSIEGGEPKRLTHNNGNETVMGWTPDGKVAYMTTEGQPYAGRQAKLMIVSANGGVPEETPIKEIAAGSFFSTGRKIVYNRFGSFGFNWRRYRGGSQGKISIYDFDKNEYSELPAKRDQNFFPMVIGDSIVYVSDKANGTLNLYKNAGGKDTQITKFEDGDIRFPATDGKTVVYERNGFLNWIDPTKGTETRLQIRIPSENLASRPALKNLATQISGFALSPSGNRIAVEARGEIFSLPARTGETRNMTLSSGVREMNVDWSPDGKWISYLSDKSGEREIHVQPQLGGEEKALTSNSSYRIENYVWTPDSKKIVFMTADLKAYLLDVESKKITLVEDLSTGASSMSFSADSKYAAYTLGRANGWKSIYIMDLTTMKKVKVSEGYYDDGGVAFDKNGKYLYFSSSRTFTPSFGETEFSLKQENSTRLYAMMLKADLPNPFADKNDEEVAGSDEKKDDKKEDKGIDFDGIEDRVIVLPMGPGNYGGLTSADNGFFYVSEGTLFQYTVGQKQPVAIYQGVGAFAFNPSGSKIAVLGAGGLQILPVQPGLSPQGGRVDTSNVEAIIDPKAEWKQMFWDAWRYERDYFYDKGMAGVDWKAIGDKYAAMLPSVNHRSDLSYIFGQLIGELGTGHAYVQGPGDTGPAPFPRVTVGTLAADYEMKDGGVMIKKIVKGFAYREETQTPLGMPGVGVKEGEFLVAIDGKPVTTDMHPNQLLLGKVGKLVTLSINSKPGMEGARKVRVRPIASDQRARYEEFIEGNRQMVAKLSGGKIGYMHIQNTAAEGSSDFVRGYWSQSDKEAMIVDERWNGGGYIQPWFVETLGRKKRAMIQPRNGADQPEAQTIEGPMAMLVNGYAGSGGDFFPYMFKQSKRGMIIGKRTWGGLVGISGGYGLVDGGSLTAPTFSIYNPDTNEIIAENTGVDPDMDIDMRPDLVVQGRDPQLEAAVKHLMDELAKMPAKKVRKDVPKVNKNGKINP